MIDAPDITPIAVVLVECWSAIRRHHPEVPPAIITIGPSTAAGRNAVTAGHWSPSRWATPGADIRDDKSEGETRRHHEVVITGEGLSDTTEGIFDTLLHEATHGLAHVRGIKDTSRDGRYHNKRFHKLADEMGLDAVENKVNGFSQTTPRAATLDRFRPELERLRAVHAALGMVFRVPSPVAPRGPNGPSDTTTTGDEDGDEDGDTDDEVTVSGGKKVALACSCGFRIWIAAGVWRDRRPEIACLNKSCGTLFAAAD